MMGPGGAPYNQNGSPVTMDQAVQIANQYLSVGNPDLQLASVHEFTNGFEAEYTEKSTGLHAFQILIDPYSEPFYDVVAMVIALGVLLSPMIAGAAMAMSSVTVVTNANRLRGWKPPIAWFFWFSEKGTVQTAEAAGVQEADIVVKAGYTPDVIVVKAGKPVRLRFTRQETSPCSEMVVFGDFGKSATLPPGQPVVIELTPDKPGEYDFACQMGMLRGKLIVE